MNKYESVIIVKPTVDDIHEEIYKEIKKHI